MKRSLYVTGAQFHRIGLTHSIDRGRRIDPAAE
jgi:hypothetical protein